jgi:hypothetical protein
VNWPARSRIRNRKLVSALPQVRAQAGKHPASD